MKTTIFLSFLAVFMKHVSSVLILPILISRLTGEELGLWYLLLSLQFVVFLFDLGFNANFIRTYATAYAGARRLKTTEIASLRQNKPNFTLLSAIHATSKKIYSATAIVSFVLLLLFYPTYISPLLSRSDNIDFDFWIYFCYCLNLSLLLQLNSVLSMLTGIGQLRLVQLSYALQVAVFLFCVFFFMHGNYVFYKLLFFYMISLVLQRFWLYFSVKRFTQKYMLAKGMHGRKKQAYVMTRILMNVRKNFVILIGTFLSNRALYFFITLSTGLIVAGSYGLILQIAVAVTAVSLIPVNVYLPKMVELQVSRNFQKFRSNALALMGVYCILSFIGLLLLGFLLEKIIILINPNFSMLNVNQIVILFSFVFLEGFHSCCCLLIGCYNIIPHVRASLVTGGLIVFSGAILTIFDAPIEGFLYAQLLCNLAYNNWYWPTYLWKKMHADFS